MSDSKPENGHIGPPPLASLGAVRRRPSGLGRGLSALLDDAGGAGGEGAAAARPAGGVASIPVAAIQPMPGQPRRHFDEGALAELAASVAQRGVLQPILVRPLAAGSFQLIAGERRWRAAQRAGLHQIPALVRDLSDSEAFEIALVENIQRSDLNAIEEAAGYRRLIAEFGHSQDALAQLVGKSRSHVANLMRLLDLPPPVQQLVAEGALAMGHARALIGVDDAEDIAAHIVKSGLSVRKVEQLIRRRRDSSPPRRARAHAGAIDSDVAAVEAHLAECVGMPVAITYPGDGSGQLAIRFQSLEQLDLLCQRLSGEPI